MAMRGVLGMVLRDHVHPRGVPESQDPSISQELHTGQAIRPYGIDLRPYLCSCDREQEDTVDLHPVRPALVTSVTKYVPPPAPPRPTGAEGVTPPAPMDKVGATLRPRIVIGIEANGCLVVQ